MVETSPAWFMVILLEFSKTSSSSTHLPPFLGLDFARPTEFPTVLRMLRPTLANGNAFHCFCRKYLPTTHPTQSLDQTGPSGEGNFSHLLAYAGDFSSSVPNGANRRRPAHSRRVTSLWSMMAWPLRPGIQSASSFFDKNSLLGGLYISKGKLCVKEFLSQHLGFVWGFSAGTRVISGVEVGRGRFQLFDEALHAVFRLMRAHLFLPSRKRAEVSGEQAF
jgi:hypothetical protein